MRAGRLALLEDCNRYIAETLGRLGMLLDELAEPDRGRQSRRSGTDDQEPDLDALVDRVGRRADRLGGGPRRRIVGRANAQGEPR
jgi:hypothetical protein